MISQQSPENVGGLLNNREIRNYVNDSFLVPFHSLLHGKSHRGNRLTATRRYRQRVQPLFPLPFPHACMKDFTTLLI